MFQTISRPSALFGAGIPSWSALWRRWWQALSRRTATRGGLEHLGSLPLTAQSSLALVRLNKETLLLAITPQGITLLTKNREPNAEAVRKGDPSTWAPAMAGGHSLVTPPENRGVVLSERSESKGDGSGASGLAAGLHNKKKPTQRDRRSLTELPVR